MSPSRGTDADIEQRQVRSRQEKEGVDRWLEDWFFGASEATLLGIPALLALMDVQPNGPVKFAGLIGWLVLSTGVGTVRGGWIERTPAWLPKTAKTLPVLLGFHSAVLWLAAVGGARAELATGSALASIAVAVLVPLVGVVGVALAVERFCNDGRR